MTYKITKTVECDFIILIFLYDLEQRATVQEIVTHIQQKRYWRRNLPDIALHLHDSCQLQSFTYQDGFHWTLTSEGRARLRDLCELSRVSRGQLKYLTTSAYRRIVNLSKELKKTPFTHHSANHPSQKRTVDTHYAVYVVLLRSSISIEHPWVIDINPLRRTNMPHVYIGMTGSTPERRFQYHKEGGIYASKYVEQYGVRLMPDLYAHLNPMTKYQANQQEKRLAVSLRKEGFTVLAGHHDWSEIQNRNQ